MPPMKEAVSKRRPPFFGRGAGFGVVVVTGGITDDDLGGTGEGTLDDEICLVMLLLLIAGDGLNEL